MLKTDAKNKIIRTIKDLDDERILYEIYRLLEVDVEEDIYKTNNTQKEAVNAALSEIKEGETLTEQQANEQTTAWLTQKSSLE